MTLRQSCLLVMLGLCVMCLLPGCNKPPINTLGADVDISLSISNGNCVQTVGGNAVTYVGVSVGQKVKWAAPNAQTSCSVSFNNTSADCPFYSATSNQCSYTCSNGVVESAAATGTAGTQYVYNSVNVGGNSCTIGTNGIIINR